MNQYLTKVGCRSCLLSVPFKEIFINNISWSKKKSQQELVFFYLQHSISAFTSVSEKDASIWKKGIGSELFIQVNNEAA